MADTVSASTLNTWIGLSDAQKQSALGQMSDETKQALLQGLRVRNVAPAAAAAPIAPRLQGPPNSPQPLVPNAHGAVGNQAPEYNFATKTAKNVGNIAKGVAQVATDAPTLNNPVPGPAFATAVANAPEIVRGPARELRGEPQPGASVLSAPTNDLDKLTGAASSLMGGNPGAARMEARSGDLGSAAADYVGTPAAMVGIGALLKLVPGLSNEAKLTAPTRREVNALASVIDKGVREGAPQEVAQAVQPLYKQALQELRPNVKDGQIADLFPSREHAPQSDIVGNVGRGNKLAVEVADKAMDIADRPLRQTITTYGPQSVPKVKAGVLADINQQIATATDKDLEYALTKIRDQIASGGDTVGDLNALKAQANKEITNLRTGPPGKASGAAATQTSAYAWRQAGMAIRANLYPELERLGGPELRPYTAREAAAFQARDGVYSQYFDEVAPKQADYAGKTYAERVFEGSLYEKQLWKRALSIEPSPAGAFNKSFARGVGPLGEGATPETVQAGPASVSFGRPQGQLPPPPGGGGQFAFTIPTGLPEEVINGKGVVPAEKVYAGTRTVPINSEEGIPVPNSRVQRRELGSTAGAVPDTSIRGPQTRTETQWQYLNPEPGVGETVSRGGGGTLSTINPAVARDTLTRLLDIPKPTPEIKAAIQSLQDQLRQYSAYAGQTRPSTLSVTPGSVTVTPGTLGTRTISRAGRRAGALAGVRASLPPPPTPQQ